MNESANRYKCPGQAETNEHQNNDAALITHFSPVCEIGRGQNQQKRKQENRQIVAIKMRTQECGGNHHGGKLPRNGAVRGPSITRKLGEKKKISAATSNGRLRVSQGTPTFGVSGNRIALALRWSHTNIALLKGLFFYSLKNNRQLRQTECRSCAAVSLCVDDLPP